MPVLVVDDDFRVAALHAQFVSAVQGFEVVGVAHTAEQARQAAAELKPDLVLLEMYLPDGLGSDLVPELRCDVMMITAASDAVSVPSALTRGAVNYLIKPFTRNDLADRLRAYAGFRQQVSGQEAMEQVDIDRAVRVLRAGDTVGGAVRKGRSSQTAHLVVDLLCASTDAVTAQDVATELGISRPTAQRYLADLADDGRVTVSLRYGATGRPEHRYTWT